MTIKHTVAVAALCLSVVTTSAKAEQGKDFFPFRAPRHFASELHWNSADTGNAAYPDLTNRSADLVPEAVVERPSTGRKRSMETFNALSKVARGGETPWCGPYRCGASYNAGSTV